MQGSPVADVCSLRELVDPLGPVLTLYQVDSDLCLFRRARLSSSRLVAPCRWGLVLFVGHRVPFPPSVYDFLGWRRSRNDDLIGPEIPFVPDLGDDFKEVVQKAVSRPDL